MIRLYRPHDKSAIESMLDDEDVPSLKWKFEQHQTTVLEEDGEAIGFFTTYTQQGYKSLAHFCIRKDRRSLSNIMRLLIAFKKSVRESGVKKTILHSDREYIDKLIERYFKIKPYARTDEYRFYLVEV